ncbi:uncharacterized protein LY79DRAFT_71840 [Colletotrichum navitas]|uniref:Uncharacterized protein n=1 Tax=Colletotrichum navitas TaxID=681940 RepID=A0AAD8PLP8_9PEZI|nr:uncharacterized protein LY79DRAFT_71840 [Colletotrichum navitas]KAK1569604.1 hypothetical protein LY79DRAFT_71840 [Colletotrichum navitas]
MMTHARRPRVAARRAAAMRAAPARAEMCSSRIPCSRGRIEARSWCTNKRNARQRNVARAMHRARPQDLPPRTVWIYTSSTLRKPEEDTGLSPQEWKPGARLLPRGGTMMSPMKEHYQRQDSKAHRRQRRGAIRLHWAESAVGLVIGFMEMWRAIHKGL